MSRLALQLLMVGAAFVLVVRLAGGLAKAPTASSPMTLSGAYTGPGNAHGLTQFGDWRGSSPQVVLDYLANWQWSDIDSPTWTLDAWRRYHARGGKLVLSVPMLVDSPAGTFAAGAQGAYDPYYKRLGQRLVAAGDDAAVLRIGWEFNGTWFPWSVNGGDPAMDAQAYVADWRHLVTLFRAIPGGHFRFDWTVNPGPSNVPAADAYPGNRYVDDVGVDVYDASWDANGHPITDPAARWNDIANQRYGLNWWRAFAKAHGKPISVPEWGLDTVLSTNGAGDDPSFVTHMYHWFKANQPAYEMYFDYGSSVLDKRWDPRASAEYRKLFGTH